MRPAICFGNVARSTTARKRRPDARATPCVLLVLDGVRYVQTYPPKAEGDAYPEAFLYEVHEDGKSKLALRGGSSGDFEMLGRIHRPSPPARNE
jgi:hypothetical protein